MVVSVNKDVSNIDFERLLSSTITALQNNAKQELNRYLQLLGNKLEDEVFNVMCSCAKNTSFENTIELVSGQKFPDIIANNFFGVEVKSTKQNHWRTTGNSVLESTRVGNIERIYMLFGKIHTPIEFKFRPYEECLYDVIVTHSPRYAIDMELDKGKTIFDKINLNYETIRRSENPIKPFKEYYRNKLSEGQELWWIDSGDYSPEAFVFKIWNSLSKNEKFNLKILAYTYFPEILGKKQTKFDKFTLWLSLKEKVICPNVRDLFTAGGQENLIIGDTVLKLVPKVLAKFIQEIDAILYNLVLTEIDVINDIWNTDFTTREEINAEWISRVINASAMIYNFDSFSFKTWLENNIENIANGELA